MSRRVTLKLLLTQHALQDIQAIYEFSVEHWGKRAAEKYLDEIEAGLERVKSQPSLLRTEPELHAALTFYRVKKHLLVCDVSSESIVVLTIVHASMDIPKRLVELQPTLAAEVELLRRRLRVK